MRWGIVWVAFLCAGPFSVFGKQARVQLPWPAAGGTNALVVLGDLIEIDNRQGATTFDGNVTVDAPDFKIQCKRLVAQRGVSNSLDLVTCTGDVRIQTDARRASAGRCDIHLAEQRLVLTGPPRPEISDAHQHQAGDRIEVYWATDRIVLSNGRIRMKQGWSEPAQSDAPNEP